jgi:hypothetical protein
MQDYILLTCQHLFVLVPTNYRIKAKSNASGKKLTEEDKNLGRWVNRQRSLFQSGKLRKDRQLVRYILNAEQESSVR